MYQVILFLDESSGRNYYYGYTKSDDTTLGNISVDVLPPYQDINEARACYWDGANSAWVFDEDKYAEILENIAAEEAARKEEEMLAASAPTNNELADAAMETAEAVCDLSTAVDDIAMMLEEMTIAYEERFAALEETIAALTEA